MIEQSLSRRGLLRATAAALALPALAGRPGGAFAAALVYLPTFIQLPPRSFPAFNPYPLKLSIHEDYRTDGRHGQTHAPPYAHRAQAPDSDCR